MTGLRRHLRSRRSELRSANTIVLGIAAAGSGRPCWWVSDGPFIPMRYAARLRGLAARAGGDASWLAARPVPGPRHLTGLARPDAGAPGAHHRLPGRPRAAPRSHQTGDTAAALDPAALDGLVQFALTVVDAIDADLARTLAAAPPLLGQRRPRADP